MSLDVRFGAIRGFRLVTAAPEPLAAFYRAIGFDIGQATPIANAEMAMLGLAGGGVRRTMILGASRVDLDVFERAGRRYPEDARACDPIFQHLALVTDDVGAAWRRALDAGATEISLAGPVRLPSSAGGVTALKFRDPEGRPLEFLRFPPGARTNWSGKGVLGIDHSAICVSNLAVSKRFYADNGLSEGEGSFNRGPTQAILDGLADVEVDVVAMNPLGQPPHVELLGYRRPMAKTHVTMAANDIAATRIVWRSNQNALLRDPDGHWHQLSRQVDC